jgi:hypothetical protein
MRENPNARYVRYRLAQLFCVVTTVFLSAATGIDGLTKDIVGQHDAHAFRIAGALILAAMICLSILLTVIVRHLRSPDSVLGPPEFNKAGPEDVRILLQRAREVAENYRDETVRFFLDMMVSPNQYAVRVIEEAVIDQGSLRLETTVTLEVPGYLRMLSAPSATHPTPPTVVVPLIRAKKGALLDNLTIIDADRASVAVLSQRETKSLISYVATDLYWRSYVSADNPLNFRALNREQRRILSLILIAVTQAGEINSDLLGALQLMLGTPANAANPTLAMLLNTLLEFVTAYYFVAVEVPAPSRRYLYLQHSNQLPVFEQATAPKDRLRLYLGLTPFRFTIPLYWPFVAASYHFQMKATAGQYVSKHTLFRISGHDLFRAIKQSDFAEENPRPYLRTRYQAGVPYAHFYSRDMNTIEAFNLCTRVEFAEVPPGTLGAAAAVSLATLLLIAVFTFLGNTHDANLFSLLLASPAFVASFVGLGADNQSLLRTSLSARFGLLSSGLLSLASTLLYVAQASGVLNGFTGRFGLFAGSIVVAHLSYPWLYLMVTAILNSGYLLAVLVGRTHHYARDVQHQGILDNVHLA